MAIRPGGQQRRQLSLLRLNPGPPHQGEIVLFGQLHDSLPITFKAILIILPFLTCKSRSSQVFFGGQFTWALGVAASILLGIGPYHATNVGCRPNRSGIGCRPD